jgi:cell division protein FtsB
MDDLEQICTPVIPNSIVVPKALDKLGKQNANLFRENEALKKEISDLKEIEKQLNYELAIARQNTDDWKEVAEGLMRIHANDERMNAVAI